MIWEGGFEAYWITHYFGWVRILGPDLRKEGQVQWRIKGVKGISL